MDPVTHGLIGAGIAKVIGLSMTVDNPAYIGVVLGSMAPDLDIVMQRWGDYVYLKNHRGFSHSIPGLLAFAGLITVCLAPFYGIFNFFEVFFWSFIGCLSHSGIDMLNSFGVEFLWPFYKKKIKLGLFIVFDPIVFLLLVLNLLVQRKSGINVVAAIGVYIVIRALMFYKIHYIVKQHFGVESKDVSILPSMVGSYKCHFIVRMNDRTVVGEKFIFGRKTRILKELKTIDQSMIDFIMDTPVAKFFTEFTPLYHIVWDDINNVFEFIDVRYFLKDSFLHHATATMNADFKVIDQKFHPYSISRNVDIPV